jgi:oxygen-independent coproporphyrinogen-3 oxidase
MSLGLYIHIPFCLQRCYYCDFATYTQSEVNISLEEYLSALKVEIRKSSPVLTVKELKTIYFGGGTPSLLTVEQFDDILNCLSHNHFYWRADAEITIEINPATLNAAKIRGLQKLGVNRFSVGAQTFKDTLLKKLNRKHSAQDTRNTLNLLNEMGTNYSFDLLFALPNQTIDDLMSDLNEIEFYRPPHISPYYLTVPENHILTPGRPPEDTEIQMFQLIRSRLTQLKYNQYEISNFSLSKESESKHNLIYWNDSSYIGFGLSSHSYLNNLGRFGTRYSNPKSLGDYLKWVKEWSPVGSVLEGRSQKLIEVLQAHESLTDFCHTSLRKAEGLSLSRISKKFGFPVISVVEERMKESLKRGLVKKKDQSWVLTDQGKDLSNQVFLDLTFLEQDYPCTRI